jgi:hypothetical protein
LEKGDSRIHVQRITNEGPVKRTGRRKIMVNGLIMDRRAIWEKAEGGEKKGRESDR